MITETTARVMAKNWRAGNAAERANIERAITRNNAWDMFRYGCDNRLIAKLGPIHKARERTADCHFYYRSSHTGI